MKQTTVTIPLSEYEETRKVIEKLERERITKFLKTDYISLEKNQYTMSIDMDKMNDFLDKHYPDRQNIVYGRPKGSNNSLDTKTEQPLLTITLQDESSAPTVIYKGEEVKGKQSIQFDWETSDAVSMGGLTYAIEHVERNKDYPAINRIERRVKDHA